MFGNVEEGTRVNFRSITLAALGAIAAFPGICLAGASVWFELAAASHGYVVHQGVGDILEIETTSEIGDLVIDMFADITTTPVYTFNTTLRADGPALVLGSGSIPPPNGTELQATFEGIGPGPVAVDFGATTSSGPGYLGNRIFLSTVTLRYDLRNQDSIRLTAEIGTLLWGQSDQTPATVSFASGDPVDGGTAGDGGDMVVAITRVEPPAPEPSTLYLFTVALTMLIRRNRTDGRHLT